MSRTLVQSFFKVFSFSSAKVVLGIVSYLYLNIKCIVESGQLVLKKFW